MGRAFVHLVSRNRRRWGGYIVHVGIVVIFTAFAGRAFEQKVQQHVMPGESIEVASPFGHTYTVRYEGISTTRGQNMFQWVALTQVEKDGEPIGTAIQLVDPTAPRTGHVDDLVLARGAKVYLPRSDEF